MTTSQIILAFMDQTDISDDAVRFDTAAISDNRNGKICMLSSKGLSSGTHQWQIQVLKSDVELQEIGVVSSNDMTDLSISNKGAIATAQLKSRALYGCDLGQSKLFYGSWNDDNSARCYRDLTTLHKIGWVVGDIIRIVVNLSKWRIKFFLNGKAVKKVMSLQTDRVYHPVVCFSGNCRYKLL